MREDTEVVGVTGEDVEDRGTLSGKVVCTVVTFNGISHMKKKRRFGEDGRLTCQRRARP